jgi:hypothetical protein
MSLLASSKKSEECEENEAFGDSRGFEGTWESLNIQICESKEAVCRTVQKIAVAVFPEIRILCCRPTETISIMKYTINYDSDVHLMFALAKDILVEFDPES